MKKLFSRITLTLAFIAGLLTSCTGDWQLNMTEGVTPISRDIYWLHWVILLVCVFIGIVVFGVMIYSIVKFRKSKGAKAATFHENTRLEILWAIIPFLILVIMAIPATQVLMRMEDSSESMVTIKITGYQWKWQYTYLDQGISFFSNMSTPLAAINNQQKKTPWYLLEVDNPLVVPIKQKIRFLVTSNDVIHSWWVPALGIKRDAIPGFIHEAWAYIETPGTYRGQCAELCGINHAYMPIVVKAVTAEEYQQWVLSEQEKIKAKAATKILSKEELMALGESTYNKYCAACHKEDGSGNPPAFPALKGDSVAVGGDINRHIDIILNGVNGSAMQAFAEQLADDEIAAVVTYERNAWGNNTGDVVQPEDVKKRRKTQ